MDDMHETGSLVVAYCAPSPNVPHFMGEVCGHYTCPTYIINRDGHLVAWAAHLTRPATKDEEVAYWKERALAAERDAARQEAT